MIGGVDGEASTMQAEVDGQQFDAGVPVIPLQYP